MTGKQLRGLQYLYNICFEDSNNGQDVFDWARETLTPDDLVYIMEKKLDFCDVDRIVVFKKGLNTKQTAGFIQDKICNPLWEKFGLDLFEVSEIEDLLKWFSIILDNFDTMTKIELS